MSKYVLKLRGDQFMKTSDTEDKKIGKIFVAITR